MIKENWKKAMVLILGGIIIAGGLFLAKKKMTAKPTNNTNNNSSLIVLPSPKPTGQQSLESVLWQRRSVREFRNEPLTLAEISQLLWAAGGLSDEREQKRTYPSAGALYPLEFYLVASKVEGLTAGSYHYQAAEHRLRPVKAGAYLKDLSLAALGQASVAEAPAVLVVAAVYERTTGKYGERGRRYVLLEAGHAGQNFYLQATALNLGTVAVGAFDDDRVKKLLSLPSQEEPLYLFPVGRKKV